MYLSKAMLYAIHALHYMSFEVPHRPVMVREICDKNSFSYDSALMVLRRLCRAKILMVHRGSKGGFSLRRPLRSIDLLALTEAIDGPLDVTDPLPSGVGNVYLKSRTLTAFSELNEDWRTHLSTIKLPQLLHQENLSP